MTEQECDALLKCLAHKEAQMLYRLSAALTAASVADDWRAAMDGLAYTLRTQADDVAAHAEDARHASQGRPR